MTATRPARITAAGWGWRYGGRRAPAVSDVSFTIEPGQRVLLLGASGAGKSTLLAGMAGLLGGADEGDETGSLLIDDERRRNPAGLLMSLNMLIETLGGFDYTGAECTRWMREAGFAAARVESLPGDHAMVIGVK